MRAIGFRVGNGVALSQASDMGAGRSGDPSDGSTRLFKKKIADDLGIFHHVPAIYFIEDGETRSTGDRVSGVCISMLKATAV